jgi:hypothetical protein
MTHRKRQFAIVATMTIAVAAVGLAPRVFRSWVEQKSIRAAASWAIKEGTTVAAAIEHYHAENGAYPNDLERDFVPNFSTAVTGGWYLNRDEGVPTLALHSNLPEWLLQYDFRSKKWTVDLVGRLVDISSEVVSARRSP